MKRDLRRVSEGMGGRSWCRRLKITSVEVCRRRELVSWMTFSGWKKGKVLSRAMRQEAKRKLSSRRGVYGRGRGGWGGFWMVW